VRVFVVNGNWLLQLWHAFLFHEGRRLSRVSSQKQKAARLSGPGLQSESKI
jgi:hypothetical protein